MKITLNHPLYKINFNNQKQNLDKSVSAPLVSISEFQTINFKINHYLGKSRYIQYRNGQYYGKTSSQGNPQGSGILIDDEFNFFVSNWKDGHKMNGLTFAKLIDETMMYGTWINGQMNGYNVIKMNLIEIFIHCRGFVNYQKQNIVSPILIINYHSEIAYLLQVENQFNQKDESLHTYGKISKENNKLDLKNQKSADFPMKSFTFKVINRKSIEKLINKQSKINERAHVNPNAIFNDEVSLKIPQYLYSPWSFFSYLTHNNETIQVKELRDINDKYLYFDISDHQRNPVSHQLKFRSQNMKQKEGLRIKEKKLSLIINKFNFETKSIGQFDNNLALNGVCLDFGPQGIILGQFKKNILVKQLNYLSSMRKSQLFNPQVRKTLKNYHMKAVSYKHDIVYFNFLNHLTSKFLTQALGFIEIFQIQYMKRHQEDSSSSEQQSFQKKYEPPYQQQTHKQIKENQLSMLRNTSNQKQYGRKNELTNRPFQNFNLQTLRQNQRKNQMRQMEWKVRPFGFIVNSRSPLRNINNKSASKSPENTQTFRKTNVSYLSPHKQLKTFIRQKQQMEMRLNKGKGEKELRIRTSYGFIDDQENYNRETTKNHYQMSEKTMRQNYFRKTSTEQVDKIIDTVRITTDLNDFDSYGQKNEQFSQKKRSMRWE